MAETGALLTRNAEVGSAVTHTGILWRETGYFGLWKRTKMRLEPDLRGDGNGAISHRGELTGALKYTQYQSINAVEPNEEETVQHIGELFGFEVNLRIRRSAGGVKDKTKSFRCMNARQQRNWMVAFGATGSGVYANGDPNVNIQSLESWVGRWDVIHPDMTTAQQIARTQVRSPPRSPERGQGDESLPSYKQYMIGTVALSIGFSMVHHQREHQASERPPVPTFVNRRREVDDTFLPPQGPPIKWPFSMGVGPEVGLPEGIQMMCDQILDSIVFVDHVNSCVLYEDPRKPPPPVQQVPCTEIPVGDGRWGSARFVGKSPNRVLDGYALAATAQPHGVVIHAQGRDGQPGYRGSDGTHGSQGRMGSPGRGYGNRGVRGADGKRGENASRGHDGTHATNASHVRLHVEGSVDCLALSGDVTATRKDLGVASDHVVFLNGRGGRGGDGGAGGRGGDGGRGGQGGDGASGEPGKNATVPGARGGAGGRGGNGGDGGRGGDGGDGADGGTGGNAGNGGHLEVTAYDPRLFILVAVDARAGLRGTGGVGGEGGNAGRGGGGGMRGSGGHGGRGGPRRENVSQGSSGSRGSSGICGLSGVEGKSGKSGRYGVDGQPGQSGSILWTLLNENDDKPVCAFGVRYEIQVAMYTVTSEVNDNIFEPNEQVIITDILLANVGEMFSPEGCRVVFKTTETIKFRPIEFTLPKLEAGQSMIVPGPFRGRIYDVPSPNAPGPYADSATMVSRVDLLNRPFAEGAMSKSIDVQYPIRIDHMEIPTHMGRGEEKIFLITLKNVSSMYYGDGPDSGGLLEVRIRVDRRLLVLPKEEFMMNSNYAISFDPMGRDSIVIRVYRIEALGPLVISIPICLEKAAELLDHCIIQCDLVLRGKLIEYQQAMVRVTPYFIHHQPQGDVLLITGPKMTRSLFVLWQSMMEWLDVQLDFWDTERYGGVSVQQGTNQRHPVSWVDRYRNHLILYPYCEPDLLRADDVISHFYTTTSTVESEVEASSRGGEPTDSAMILVTHDEEAAAFSRIFQGKLAHTAEKSAWAEEHFGGWHLCSPNSCRGGAARRKMKKLVKKLEKKEPKRNHIVLDWTENHELVDYSCLLDKYSYGSLDLRPNPLDRSCKMFLIHESDLLHLEKDDPFMAPNATEIPAGSSVGQILLTSILWLPIACKTRLLRRSEGASVKPVLALPIGKKYTIRDLTAMSFEFYLDWEIQAKLDFPHNLHRLANEIEREPSIYSEPDISPYILVACRVFLKKCKKCSDDYARAATDIYRRIKEALRTRNKEAERNAQSVATKLIESSVRPTYANFLAVDDITLNPQRLVYKDNLYELNPS